MHSIPEAERNCKDIDMINFLPLLSVCHHRRSLASSGSKPVPRQFNDRPDTINLRSSAFICGSFFVEAPDSKDSDRINRMDRINSSTNPVNPVHPVQAVSHFSAAPDIHNTFIGLGNTLYIDRMKSSCA